MKLIPRYKRQIPNFNKIELNKPVYTQNIISLIPSEILEICGNINEIKEIEQGLCNLILLLITSQGIFILKISKGPYRTEELLTEHVVMQSLAKTDIPVPTSLLFSTRNELGFQLRECLSGEPLNKILHMNIQAELLYRHFGAMLKKIHSVNTIKYNWDEWLRYALINAKINMENEVIDPGEFNNESPQNLLKWLQNNIPKATHSVFLHGDYRPKNILWDGQKINGVLDWSFSDFGDPYYDLGIAMETIQTTKELTAFSEGYGEDVFDQKRIVYMQNLSKFINV